MSLSRLLRSQEARPNDDDVPLSSSGLERVRRAERTLLLLLIGGLPLAFLPRLTYEPFSLPKLALLLAGVSIAFALRVVAVIMGARKGPGKEVAIPVAFIVVPLLVSWLASDDKGWSLFGQHGRFEGLLPYALVGLAGILIASAFVGRALTVAWMLVGSATIVAGYGILQALGLDPLDLPVDTFVTSTVGHGNFLGGFLAIVLPVAFSIWSGDLPGRRWAMGATVVLGLGLLISMSQGPWAAAVAGLSVTMGLLLSSRWRRAPLLGILAAAALVAVVVGTVVLSMVVPESPLVGGTSRARGLWWQAAFSMSLDSPIVGHGPNGYAVQSPSYRSSLDALAHGNALSDNPHSVPMAMLANAGILGLMGFLLLAAWVARRAATRWRTSPLAMGLVGGATAYFVQSLVGLDELILTFSLWVVLGALVACTSGTDDTAHRRARPISASVWLAAVVAVVLVLAGTVGAARLLRADRLVLKGVRAFQQDEVKTGKAHFLAAFSFRDEPMYRETLGDHLGSAAMKRGLGGRPLLDDMMRQFSYLEDLPFVHGMVTQAHWLHQWSIYDLATDEQAVAVLNEAVAADPHNPEVRVALAESLLHLGRAQEAERVLRGLLPSMDRYRAFSAHHPMVWATLAMAEHESGRKDSARSTLRLAIGDSGWDDAVLSDCHIYVATVLIYEERVDSLTDGARPICPPALLDLLDGGSSEGV